MWELNCKDSWVRKNWCFWTVVLKTLESPLDCKEIQPLHPKGNQSWIFIERTDAEAETPILRPPDVKNWLIRKDPDARKDWRSAEKGTTGDELVGWHHWCNRHEFEWALGIGDGQGSLACCSPWGRKESDTTDWLNRTEPGWINIHPNNAETDRWFTWNEIPSLARLKRKLLLWKKVNVTDLLLKQHSWHEKRACCSWRDSLFLNF